LACVNPALPVDLKVAKGTEPPRRGGASGGAQLNKAVYHDKLTKQASCFCIMPPLAISLSPGSYWIQGTAWTAAPRYRGPGGYGRWRANYL